MSKFTIKRNKMLGKKGFAMAELLAVSVIVMGIFTILFSNFLPLVAEYENRMAFNSVTSQYAAHHARIIIRETMPKNYTNNDIDTNGYKVLWQNEGWVDTMNFADSKTKLEKLLKEYDIEEMIITKYDITTTKEKYPSTGQLYKYISYLPTYKDVFKADADEPYRLILKSGKFGYATTGLLYEIYEPPQPNHPVMVGNMIAVRHFPGTECSISENRTYGCWKTVSEKEEKASEWYNYDNKEWANSMVVTEESFLNKYKDKTEIEVDMNDVLTMQVWIPRFAYTVWNYNIDGLNSGSKTKINIEFDEQEDDGTFKIASEITCKDVINQDGVSETCDYQFGGEKRACTNNLCSGRQYVHPAFTLKESDGIVTELTGFWAGKFEVAKENSNPNILVKPNLTTLANLRVGDFYTELESMNNTNNIYGFNTAADTHMIKNMEWGAISYLTYSKYGVCEKEGASCTGTVAVNNHASRLTGYGPSEDQWLDKSGGGYKAVPYVTHDNNYETKLGMLASTTNNVYGVYDMNGGTREYVMGNMLQSDATEPINGNDMMSGNYPADGHYSGFKGVLYDLDGDGPNLNSGFYSDADYDYPDEIYYDKYSFGENLEDIKRSKLGDGIRELGDTTKWDSTAMQFLHIGKSNIGNFEVMPWIIRGGGKQDQVTYDYGIFHTFAESGGSRRFYTTRLIIFAFDA